jgi:hypothetical protein
MQVAIVAIDKDELQLVVETARRAAKRTNSVVVVAEDRLAITERANQRAKAAPGSAKSVSFFD